MPGRAPGGLRHRGAVRLGHRADLGNQAAERRQAASAVRVSDRQPHRGNQGGLRADEGELESQHRLDARRQLRPETGLLTAREQALGRGGVGVEGLDAEQHVVARTDVSQVVGGRRLYPKLHFKLRT